MEGEGETLVLRIYAEGKRSKKLPAKLAVIVKPILHSIILFRRKSRMRVRARERTRERDRGRKRVRKKKIKIFLKYCVKKITLSFKKILPARNRHRC